MTPLASLSEMSQHWPLVNLKIAERTSLGILCFHLELNVFLV